MIQLRMGGVPEHFNLPWRLAIEEGLFSDIGIGEDVSVEWTDYPGGTGAMNKALRAGKLDMATILTEGIVADMIQGNSSKILKIHVQTPLNWGLFVSQSSRFQDINDLRTARYAVSRMGSGSHLMAYVHAIEQGWDVNNLSFVVLNNLDGMREGLRNGQADVFMWEKVMTQPYVSSGELRRVGVCPTPWPGFVLVARNEIIEKYPQVLQAMCDAMNHFCRSVKSRPELAVTIAQRYGLQLTDVEPWLRETEWATTNQIDPKMLEDVMEKLLQAGVITHAVATSELVTVLR